METDISAFDLFQVPIPTLIFVSLLSYAYEKDPARVESSGP